MQDELIETALGYLKFEAVEYLVKHKILVKVEDYYDGGYPIIRHQIGEKQGKPIFAVNVFLRNKSELEKFIEGKLTNGCIYTDENVWDLILRGKTSIKYNWQGKEYRLNLGYDFPVPNKYVPNQIRQSEKFM